jgi:hypothetical protein
LEYGHVGNAPINKRIRTMIRIVPSMVSSLLPSPCRSNASMDQKFREQEQRALQKSRRLMEQIKRTSIGRLRLGCDEICASQERRRLLLIVAA